MIEVRVCKECFKEYEAKVARQRFCSTKCGMRYRTREDKVNLWDRWNETTSELSQKLKPNKHTVIRFSFK